jgi:hypothetical protein
VKALTLTQPWATLVAVGAKKIETRSWRTDYRGPIAIHAGKGLGPVRGIAGLRELCGREPFRSVLDAHWADIRLISGWFGELGQITREPERCLPAGSIVAVATLVSCEPTDGADARHGGGWHLVGNVEGRWYLTDQERAFGDYSPGRYAWLLADVRRLPVPIPARGALGLWTVPAEIEAQIVKE